MMTVADRAAPQLSDGDPPRHLFRAVAQTGYNFPHMDLCCPSIDACCQEHDTANPQGAQLAKFTSHPSCLRMRPDD